jgi:predicted esterase
MNGRTGNNRIALIAFIVFMSTYSACASTPNPDNHRFSQPWTYYLYLPQAYTSEQAWPLFIGINGSSSNGKDCWNVWQRYADEKGYVLLCPELADSDGRLEQLRGNSRLLDILGRVYEEFSLQKKIFLAGFSAGGQFVHGYAFMNPSYIVGVSVIATGNYYEPPTSSRHIPFVVIVGENDHAGNVKNANQLAGLLAQGGYYVELHVLSGEGHTISKEAIEITLSLFDRTVASE